MSRVLRNNPNQNYTFMEMANLSWDMLKEEWRDRGPTEHFMSDFLDDVKLYSRLTQDNVVGVVLVTFLFTVHRWIFTRLILNVSSTYVCFMWRFFNKVATGTEKLRKKFFFQLEKLEPCTFSTTREAEIFWIVKIRTVVSFWHYCALKFRKLC